MWQTGTKKYFSLILYLRKPSIKHSMIRKIVNHLKAKWYRYIIEIIVVIVGILIAFNLEQWSEDRKNKKVEIEILKDFKRNLSADLDDMRSNIWYHKTSIHCSEIILNLIKNDLPYHDSLDVCFSYTHTFTTFQGRLGPMEQLKNTSLSIVSNDTLRSEIISMYDEVYPRIRLVELVVERDYEELRDFDKFYFDAYDVERVSTNKSIRAPVWGIMRPLRFTELKTNPEYAALLRARISNQRGLLRLHYNPSEKALSNLLHQIDREIMRLE